MLRYCTWWLCLVGCLAFCACESEEDNAVITSDSNDFVKVNMAMAFERINAADTRMSEANTQGNSSKDQYQALGLDNVYLVPFSKSESTPPISDNSQRLRNYNPKLTLDGTFNDQKNRLYTAMFTPRGTGAFLVYAHPTGGGPDASPTDKFAHGSTIPSGLNNDALDEKASSITFSPDLIGDDNSAYQDALAAAEKMADYMTAVANARYLNGTRYIYWRDQRGDAGKLYSDFTHDGYPFSIANAEAMKTLLNTFKSYSGFDDYMSAAVTKAVDNALKTSNYNQWSSFNGISTLPNGLIVFKWLDIQHKFIVLTHETGKPYLNPNIVDPTTLAYPMQLWYYANSKIHTSVVENLSEDDLRQIFNKSPWGTKVLTNDVFAESDGVINDQTTVVAIDNLLNYGVSRLKMKIKAGVGNFPVSANQTVQNSLVHWKGLMLTHQHNARYDFQPLDDGSYYIVYDSDLKKRNSTDPIILAQKQSEDNVNHTLVIPSLEHEKIFLIAELFNSSTVNFIGHNGCVIPPQTYFYMVGQLDPAAGTKPTNSPANGNMVFESDMYTFVEAVINNFEGAYNYVPDLTSPALVLGLEVNFNWEQTEPKGVWLN